MTPESELAFLRSLPPETICFLRNVRKVFGPGARLAKFTRAQSAAPVAPGLAFTEARAANAVVRREEIKLGA